MFRNRCSGKMQSQAYHVRGYTHRDYPVLVVGSFFFWCSPLSVTVISLENMSELPCRDLRINCLIMHVGVKPEARGGESGEEKTCSRVCVCECVGVRDGDFCLLEACRGLRRMQGAHLHMFGADEGQGRARKHVPPHVAFVLHEARGSLVSPARCQATYLAAVCLMV